MKKIIFIAAMLISIAATAQQKTFVKSVSTDYVNKRVTFNISWAEGSREVPGTSSGNRYNSKVWVFVDYQDMQNGSWKRADIDTAYLRANYTTNCTADRGNTKGFWYQGAATATQNETITIKLSSTLPIPFKWCAFATDCPPRAMYNNGAYALKGTPPFEITSNNGSETTTNRNITAGTITAITDATKCPGYVQYPYSNCAASTVTLGTVGFASTKTWPIKDANGIVVQTWSAPVTATACRKITYSGTATGSSYNADCRSNNGNNPAPHSTYGDLFSWCMIAQYGEMLCPQSDGWRVPTAEDFCYLDVTLNKRSDGCANTICGGVGQNYINRYLVQDNAGYGWGAQWSGKIGVNGTFQYVGETWYVASKTQGIDGYFVFHHAYIGNYCLYPNNRGGSHLPSEAHTLRCVR